jgi:hypothetical protein
MESDLNPAYISAFSALAGAAIGGLTSFLTSWSIQRAQLRNAHREAETAKLEALYSDFIKEATRLFGDALTRQSGNVTDIIGLDAMIGRLRLVSTDAVIVAAVEVERKIVETYLGPNLSLGEVREHASSGELNLLGEFSEECRRDLASRATSIR